MFVDEAPPKLLLECGLAQYRGVAPSSILHEDEVVVRVEELAGREQIAQEMAGVVGAVHFGLLWVDEEWFGDAIV